LSEERYLLSQDQSIMAWQTGNDLSEAKELLLLNLDTGIRQTIEAPEGEYIRGLGFMGTDFIWGRARETDVQVDPLGNVMFPMHTISIQSAVGETIREFAYGDQGKYVISVSVENNRISMECVAKNTAGEFVEATPEPITNKAEEHAEKIQLKTKTTEDKKREYVFAFATPRKEGEPTRLTPKQVLFEENRTLQLLDEGREHYYVYGRGSLYGSCETANEAIAMADSLMGVVTDWEQQVIWNRSGRKTRTQISEISARELMENETSLEACLTIILNFEAVYGDVKEELAGGKNAVELLEAHLERPVMNLTGCDLSTVLYYVSEGKPVLALTGSSGAVFIVGYDQQNTVLFDPATGKLYKKGMNDSNTYFEEYGNRFVAYLD